MREEELERLFLRTMQVTEALHRTQETMREQAAERRALIASLHAAGASYSDIASHLGCSRSAIQAILRG